MAALLTSVGDSKDKLGLYLSECRRMGINVLAPDVNDSSAAFTAVGKDIRFGLGAVRNVGLNVVEGIRLSREEKGRFETFHDFLRKVPASVCNKKTVEALIKAGAFDSLGHTRRSLLEIHEEAIDIQSGLKRNEAHGQVDLFGSLFDDIEGGMDVVPDRPEWPKREKLAYEREMLGLYVSDHPLSGREAQLARHAEMTIGEFLADTNIADGEQVTLAGLVTSVAHRVAKKSGNPYGSITVEDFEGEASVMLMGKTYQQYAQMLMTDQVVSVRGRVSQRDETNSVHAYSIEVIEGTGGDQQGPIVLKLDEVSATAVLLNEISAALDAHPGEEEVQLQLRTAAADPDDESAEDSIRAFRLPQRVKITPDLIAELKALLGAKALSFG